MHSLKKVENKHLVVKVNLHISDQVKSRVEKFISQIYNVAKAHQNIKVFLFKFAEGRGLGVNSFENKF